MPQGNDAAAKAYPAWAKALCWALAAACCAVIFWLSSRTAAESSAQSDAVLEFFSRLFGDGVLTDFIVRKSAHFCEYAGLGLLLALAFYIQTGGHKIPAAVLCASLYAATDEVHQLFVEGRACRWQDWAIDTAGALAGALVLLLAVLAALQIERRIKKRGK